VDYCGTVLSLGGMYYHSLTSKNLVMKTTLHILGITLLMAALTFSITSCQSKAPESRVLSATDTTGLAQFQSWKTMNETKTANEFYMQGYKDAMATKNTAAQSQVARKPVRSASTQPVSQPAKKKGWSKAAKGTVIGTTAGAIAGALINKKNRLVGGIIGGLAGGGGGYVIGRSMDKKDGRY